MIENLPKGCIPDPVDERDYKAEPIMGAVHIDFSQEFRLPNPGDEDQGSSLSCVAQAWSYYHNQIHAGNWSRRNLYSRIFLPEGGANIRQGGLKLVNEGQEMRDKVPDPVPQTEAAMRDASLNSLSEEAAGKELSSFILPQQDINGVAWGIKNYKGVVFGVTGSNQAWQDMENPRPPQNGEELWGHALYGMGYHIHSDGMKCIIAKSSWCNEVSEHHIRENYFLTGNTFNAWTLIPKGTTSMHLAKDNGTVYLIAGVNTKVKIGIADPESLFLFGDEPIQNEDTSAIPETKTLTTGFSIHNK